MTSVTKDPVSVNACMSASDNVYNSNCDSEADDEYNTVFTKILDSQLNSTTIKLDDTSINAFEDESIKSVDSSKNTSKIDAVNSTVKEPTIQIITSHPSDTSCGYHNTFSVLERQVKVKTPSQSKQRVMMSPQSDARVSTSHGTSINTNDPVEDDEDTKSSFLELELEARQRIKDILNASKLNGSGSRFEGRERTLSSSSQHSQESANREYTEFLYHVSRNKMGEAYVKILPSPSNEKGN